ncbi:MAG: NAD-dependent epimerase/dehydratase family protein [Lachnospiraceae bacterium]|nr:NAD-dependent epimerase/dehydratase family protein [Lachnospiraceae bacterium]
MTDRIWSGNAILQEDLERIASSELIDWERFRGKRVLVTGATGLVGSIAARALVCAGEERSLNIRVAALVRNPDKAKAMLGSFLERGLELVVGDILSPIYVDGPVDFILHGASVTASKDFVDHPVETILTTLKGTEHLLELARQKQAESMVYFSSMEVYGEPDVRNYADLTGMLPGIEGTCAPEAARTSGGSCASEAARMSGGSCAPEAARMSGGSCASEKAQTAAVLRESDYGYIDPLKVRSSYSEGKRMAEGMCAAYAHEYQIPVKTARLAQTFGAGIPKTENRVFAQFAHSIMEGKDIVLHTDGSKAHCYCYTTDAILGLLVVLLKGENGGAYNISNENTYCTIREMAEMLIEKYPQSGSRLIFDIPEDAGKYGYAPTSRMLICSEKLRGLGWKPQVGLPEMFERLMGAMR